MTGKRWKNNTYRHESLALLVLGSQGCCYLQEMGKDEKDEDSSEAKALAAALSPATWPVVLLQLLDLTTELAGNGLLQAAAGMVLRPRVQLLTDVRNTFFFFGAAAPGPHG